MQKDALTHAHVSMYDMYMQYASPYILLYVEIRVQAHTLMHVLMHTIVVTHIQWNFSTVDTIGTQLAVLYREVSFIQR